MEFFTISETVQVEITEKKSKFIANFFPVQSLEEAEQIVKESKKKYHDARHNCMAYRIYEENKMIEKSSDDGEPSGTAGVPMLNILQKNQIANVVIVVTRYFGGILLGTGGLVRAYSDSLLKAIGESRLIQKCQGIEMLVTTEYSEFDSFKYYCKNNHILIVNVEYGEFITCKIEVGDAQKEKLWQDFTIKNIILKDIKEVAKKYITKSIWKKYFYKVSGKNFQKLLLFLE